MSELSQFLNKIMQDRHVPRTIFLNGLGDGAEDVLKDEIHAPEGFEQRLFEVLVVEDITDQRELTRMVQLQRQSILRVPTLPAEWKVIKRDPQELSELIAMTGYEAPVNTLQHLSDDEYAELHEWALHAGIARVNGDPIKVPPKTIL